MPDFTTKANVLVAMNQTAGGQDDANIDALIPQATAAILKLLGRDYWDPGSDVSFYPRFRDRADVFFVEYPIISITDIWESTDVPRVYDATTVLTAGEDYLHDADTGVVYRLGGYWSTAIQAVKIDYRAGIADGSQDADLVRAANIIVINWLQKGKDRSFHLMGHRLGEGAVSGIRFDDIPHTARELIELHAERRVR